MEGGQEKEEACLTSLTDTHTQKGGGGIGGIMAGGQGQEEASLTSLTDTHTGE